jgi:hypothetical protein
MSSPAATRRAVIAACLVAAALGSLAGAVRADEGFAGQVLLMVDQPGCAYCMAWDREIAPAYPNTDEGRAAPLRRARLGAALPAEVVLERPARLTPTFILLREGREVARLEGYPGPDFFWPLLGEMLAIAD